MKHQDEGPSVPYTLHEITDIARINFGCGFLLGIGATLIGSVVLAYLGKWLTYFGVW